MPADLTIVTPVNTRQRVLYPELAYTEEMTLDSEIHALVLQQRWYVRGILKVEEGSKIHLCMIHTWGKTMKVSPYLHCALEGELHVHSNITSHRGYCFNGLQSAQSARSERDLTVMTPKRPVISQRLVDDSGYNAVLSITSCIPRRVMTANPTQMSHINCKPSICNGDESCFLGPAAP